MTTKDVRKSAFVTAVLCLAVYMAMMPVASADHSAIGVEASHATTIHTTAAAPLSATASDVEKMQSLIALLTNLQALLTEQIAANHDADGHGDSHSAHSHDMLEIEKHADVPTIALTVTKDAISGFNVHAETGNFEFAPQHASEAHVLGEGHAHIYVDGVKLGRMYGPWTHLNLTEKGSHTIRVELSTNDHQVYAHDDKKIDDSVTVEVK